MPSWITLQPYVLAAARVLLIFLAAWIANRFIRRLIRNFREHLVKVMQEHGNQSSDALRKRAITLSGLLGNAATVGIWVMATVMILKEIGFDIAPLLAGAGIAGIAIGFGAQNLVRDIITGMFLLIENQIRVNDVVQINGVGGLVEEINLRTTVLRSLDGTVHILPNGTIQQVSNLTREFSYYVFELGVAYKEDTDQVTKTMQDVAEELRSDPELGASILEPLEVLGVDRFADSSVIIKARIKTKPIEQWKIGRELNRRFKKRFDELGIEIPFPHISIYAGEASKPVRLELDEGMREDIKRLIREIGSEKPQQPVTIVEPPREA